MADENSVLVEAWPTVLWRSSVNWVAWLGAGAPEALAWVLSHLDSVPPELLSLEARNYMRVVIMLVLIPLARVWKQRALRNAVAAKTAQLPKD